MSSMTSRNPSETKNSRPEWHLELAGYLGRDCFAARGDQLLAALISQRCPSSLLWHLSSLPQSRRYTAWTRSLPLRTVPRNHHRAGIDTTV